MSDLQRPVLDLTVELSEAVAAHRFVTLAGATPSAEGDPVVGLTRQGGVDGDLVSVTALGTATGVASGAIAKGAEVMATTDGRAKTHAGDVTVSGIALEAAAAENDEIEILVISRGT